MLRFNPDSATYAAALRQQFEAAYARIRTPPDAATRQQAAACVRAGGAAKDAPQQLPAAPGLASAPQQPPPAPARSAEGYAEAPCRDPSPERTEAPREPQRAGRTARLQVFPLSGTSALGGRREAAPPLAPKPRAHAAAHNAAELPRRTRKRAAPEGEEDVATFAELASTPCRSAGAEACAAPASPPPTAGFKLPAPSALACAVPSSPCSEATATATMALAMPQPHSPPAAMLPRRALIQVSSPAPAVHAPAAPAGGAVEALQLGVCSVCWDGICVAAPPGSGAELCELRPCEHAYHAACIQPWLAAQNTCPQCRVRVRARWGAARGLEAVAEADTFVQQLHTWTGRMPYDDTVCQVCHDGGAEDMMLLCDGCDRGFHTECVQLRCIPRGAWHCRSCRRAQFGPGAQFMLAMAQTQQRRLDAQRERAWH